MDGLQFETLPQLKFSGSSLTYLLDQMHRRLVVEIFSVFDAASFTRGRRLKGSVFLFKPYFLNH